MSASEYHLEIIDAQAKAAQLLSNASGLSITQVKHAMQKGAVWLTDDDGTRRLRRASKLLSIGSSLHFYYNPDVLKVEIPAPTLLADEHEYSVWIKPRGVLSQGSKWGDHSTLGRWVEINDIKKRTAFSIHRLDRAVSGLMLIGHSKRATQLFSTMFEQRRVDKKYRAIVWGKFAENPGPRRIESNIDERIALTHVRQLDYNQLLDVSLLEIEIETGRKHQIRKHLSAQGSPIVGDRLYGGGRDYDLQLAAVSLGFRCPLTDQTREYQLPQLLKPTLEQFSETRKTTIA